MFQRLFLAVCFVFPLVYCTSLTQSYELAKFIFLLVGVGILSVVWSFEALFKRNLFFSWRLRNPWWWGIALLYLCYLCIQTLFALSPEIAFWGSFQRHQGLLYVVMLAWLLVMAISVHWTEHQEEALKSTLFYSASAAAVIALLQLFFPMWLGDTAQFYGRIYGTMGHPNYLGQLLAPVTVLGWFLYAKRKHWHILFLLALQYTALFLTWNRASLVAAFLGIIALYLYHDWQKKRVTKKGIYVLSIIILTLLFAGSAALLTQQHAFRSLQTRLEVLPSTIAAIAERPWFGYGLNNAAFALSPVYRSTVAETEKFTNLPDKAHNEMIDVLIDQGVVGFFFYVALLLLMLRGALRSQNKEQHMIMLVFAVILLSHMTGFAVQTTGLLVVAMLVLFFGDNKDKAGPYSQHAVCALVGCVIGLLLITFGVQTARADLMIASSTNLEQGSQRDAIILDAVAIAPFAYEYHIFHAQYVTDHTSAMTLLDKADNTNSFDYFVPLLQGLLASRLSDFAYANERFERAILLCPECPKPKELYANALYDQGLTSDALNQYLDYIALLPSFMTTSPSELTPYEYERRRVFIKENQPSLGLVLQNALKLSQEEGLSGEEEHINQVLSWLME